MITTPIARLIGTGWAGAIACVAIVCAAPLIILLGWVSGLTAALLAVLAMITGTIVWRATRRRAIRRLRSSTLDDPELYMFGLKAGLFTLKRLGK